MSYTISLNLFNKLFACLVDFTPNLATDITDIEDVTSEDFRVDLINLTEKQMNLLEIAEKNENLEIEEFVKLV